MNIKRKLFISALVGCSILPTLCLVKPKIKIDRCVNKLVEIPKVIRYGDDLFIKEKINEFPLYSLLNKLDTFDGQHYFLSYYNKLNQLFPYYVRNHDVEPSFFSLYKALYRITQDNQFDGNTYYGSNSFDKVFYNEKIEYIPEDFVDADSKYFLDRIKKIGIDDYKYETMDYINSSITRIKIALYSYLKNMLNELTQQFVKFVKKFHAMKYNEKIKIE